MKAQINRQLINQTKYDSGALTPADFVVHPYTKAGHYQAEVSRHGQYRYSFSFSVTPECKDMQISVDLAAMEEKLNSPDNDCTSDAKNNDIRLAPGGYGLFYTASGSGGYSIRTFASSATEKDRDQVFDSTSLQTDDLFGVTLLRPGYYVMHDAQQKLQCKLQVDPVVPGKECYVPPEAHHLNTETLKKSSSSIKLMQAQGLIYRSHPDARIVIELEKPIDSEQPEPATKSPSQGKKATRKKASKKRRPVSSWKKAGVKR